MMEKTSLVFLFSQISVTRKKLRLAISRVEGAELISGEKCVDEDVLDVGVVAVPRV